MSTDIVMPPTHPGAILREEFLEPMGITEYRLAKGYATPPQRLSALSPGPRGKTGETPVRDPKTVVPGKRADIRGCRVT